MFKFFRYIVIILLGISFTSFAEDSNHKAEENSSYMPEDIAIFDSENKEHFLEEYDGKAVLLVFWATWCAPCVAEMGDLDALQKDFRKTQFVILPISEDYLGVNHVKDFYKVNNLRHLPIMHDYKNALFKELGIVGMPTSILLNAEGKRVMTFSGSVNWYDEKVRESLLKHIPGNPPMPRNSYRDNAVNYVHPKDAASKSKVIGSKESGEEGDDEDLNHEDLETHDIKLKLEEEDEK